MNRMLRWIFTLCIAYPVVWIWLGVRVAGRKKLPRDGPAIIVANHNSHLDVLTLFTLFPALDAGESATRCCSRLFSEE